MEHMICLICSEEVNCFTVELTKAGKQLVDILSEKSKAEQQVPILRAIEMDYEDN